MYIVNTCLDMHYVVKYLSQVMNRPTKLFWREVKHVLWYIRGTNEFELWYKQIEGVNLCGITNAVF